MLSGSLYIMVFYLNDSGNTIDSELKLRYFTFAGKTSAEVWIDLIVDDHPICRIK